MSTAAVIDPASGVNAETVALANELLAGLEKVAQSKVDSLKAQNKAAVSLQEKVTAYDSVAKGINNVAIDYEAAAAKFENVNDDVAVAAVSNPADAKTFQVAVGLGEDGSVLLSMENGKLVVTGFDSANGAKDVNDAAVKVAAADALVAAVKELEQADKDQKAAVTANTNAVTNADAITDATTDASAAAADAFTEGHAQLDALIDKLEAVATALNDAGIDNSFITDLYTTDPKALTDAGTKANVTRALLDAEEAADNLTTTAQNELDAADGDLTEAKAEVTDGLSKFSVDGVDDADAAIADGGLEKIEAAQKAAQDELKEAQKAGGDDDAVEVYEGLEGVDGFEAAVEALYGNIATQAAAAQAVDAAILNALKSVGYKVYEDEDSTKALSWSKVKIVDGKLVAADDEETGLVLKALDENGDVKTVAKDGAGLIKGHAYDSVKLGAELVTLPGIGGDVTKPNQIDGEASIDNDMPNIIKEPAKASENAVNELQGVKDEIKDFNKAVDAYFDAVATQEALEQIAEDVEAAAEAVAEAEGAFEELGFNLVKAVDGVANGTAFDENAEDQAADLFVYGESKLTVENFDGQDVLYFGDKAADLITITKAQAESAAGKVGGEANVLDIFAYQDGANTILLVEKEAFAGNASGAATDNPDLVEVTLTGVNAADLSFEDGFITLA